jgi:hypothetical protein
MAATQVQSKGAGKAIIGDRTQTLSFDSPPTEGNLLILLGDIENDYDVTMVSSGWTKTAQDGGSVQNGGFVAFWKTAGESEPSAVEMDYGEVNRRGGMIIYEYSNDPGLVLDQFSVLYEATLDNNKSTGTTPILSSDAVLAVTAVSLNDDNANLAGTSWTNGFTGDVAAEVQYVDFFSAVKDLDGSDETLETTATYNGSAEAGTAGLLVFRTPAAVSGLASFRDAVATDVASKDVVATDVAGRDVGA